MPTHKTFAGHWRDWASIVAVIVTATIFVGRALLPDTTLSPLDILMTIPPWSNTAARLTHAYNALPSDKIQYIQPMKTLTAQAWQSGIPLWEPQLLSGYPIIANAQAGIFYPGTLPYLFLRDTDASDLVAWLHLILAGLGMLGYLRTLHCRSLAATFGALVFMLNTVTIGWLMWDSVAGAMIWLPWVLWAFEVALRSKRWWLIGLGAVALALAYLGGHLQWTLYTLLIFGLYGLFRFVQPGAASRRYVAVTAASIAGLGTLLAAVQLLPTLDYASQGHRLSQSFAALTQGLDWSGFLTIWTPGFFGEVTREWWGTLNYNELIVYAGIAPLLLALIALIGRRDKLVLFWAIIGVFGMACAAGSEVYRVLYWLPGFNSLVPARMRYLLIVSLVVLSALGMDWLQQVPRTQRRSVWGLIAGATIAIALTYSLLRTPWLPQELLRLSYIRVQEILLFSLLIVSAFLAGWAILAARWQTAALTALCLLTVFDLWRANIAYLHLTPTAAYDYPVTPGIVYLQNQSGTFRVLTARRGYFDWQLPPNSAAVFGLFDVGGYDSVYLRRYADFMKAIDQSGPAIPPAIVLSASSWESPLVDLLNVGYAIAPDDFTAPGWERVYDSDLRIYKRTELLPRAWIASHADTLTDESSILKRLAAPDFDPRQTVILEQTPSEPAGDHEAELAGEVTAFQAANSQITVSAEMQWAGWLVISDSYYPGWSATVDGVPANVYRANAVLKAVALPLGRHQIELNFRPASFVSGAWLSGAAVVVVILLSLAGYLSVKAKSK